MIEVVGLGLGILGLFGAPVIVRFLDRSIGRWWLLSTWSRDKVRDEALKITKDSIIEFDRVRNAASYGPPINVKYYVDFMSAVTSKDQRLRLDRCVMRWIKLSRYSRIDKIAVPKLGNVLLAASIADRLGIPLVIVRQDTEQFVRGGYSLDGKLVPGEQVLLIDDVASDPVFLELCCTKIREFQARVAGILCVVNRPEGAVIAHLKKADLDLNYIIELADGDLAKLK